MGLNRTGKLIRNLILTMLALVFIWFWLGRPLPIGVDYRRQEKAQFLERKEILQCNRKLSCIVSRDKEKLYVYSREWYPRIDQFPLENGMGRTLFLPITLQVQPQDRSADPMVIMAYEESGRAASADVRLITWSMPYETDGKVYEPYYVYEAQSQKDRNLFLFNIYCQEPLDETGVTVFGMCEASLLEDIWNYECRKGFNWYSSGGYSIEITFYDKNGETIGVHRSGATFPENE